MNRPNSRMFVIVLLMLGGAGLALAMKPTQKMADFRDKPDLNAMIPQQFGEWRVDSSIVPIDLSPEVKAKLDRIYNQTLSRTYVSATGRRIMLSIAYGGDQSDAMTLHRPEVCYVAQGFEVSPAVSGTLRSEYGEFPVIRLIARQGNRNEPITYWVVVGDKTILPGIRQKLVQLSYGLAGKVPDGFLVRVSSIDLEGQTAYQQQEKFIDSMLGAINEDSRKRIVGRLGS